MQKRNKTMIFKVSLLEIKPKIWREIEVPANYSFWDLHVAIQDAMGWLDYHLHLFRICNPETGENEEIGIPDEEGFFDDFPMLPGWEIAIADYFTDPGEKAVYEYDFGDGWEHEILLKGIAVKEKGAKYARCLAGKRACPPEDCGGTLGYERLLRIIKNPKHEEHERMMEWLGGEYDPARFDADSVEFDNPKKRWETAFLEE